MFVDQKKHQTRHLHLLNEVRYPNAHVHNVLVLVRSRSQDLNIYSHNLRSPVTRR
jgi:hypothetical protein